MTAIKPTPTDEEAVAIAAALQAALDVSFAAADEQRRRVAWRFSGRWWSRPIPSRRGRPW